MTKSLTDKIDSKIEQDLNNFDSEKFRNELWNLINKWTKDHHITLILNFTSDSLEAHHDKLVLSEIQMLIDDKNKREEMWKTYKNAMLKKREKIMNSVFSLTDTLQFVKDTSSFKDANVDAMETMHNRYKKKNEKWI
jgi:hypothetical protein